MQGSKFDSENLASDKHIYFHFFSFKQNDKNIDRDGKNKQKKNNKLLRQLIRLYFFLHFHVKMHNYNAAQGCENR